MILVDTNIIIDHLKGNSSLNESLHDDFAICGIIFAELLHGARSEKERAHIVRVTSLFRWIDIEESLWSEVGDSLNTLKKQGISIPFQDVVITVICIQKNLILFTNDKHFTTIAKIFPSLKLLQ